MKKYETIYFQLKEEILQGYRRQGEKMPSIRYCVRQFHVSQTSVEHAYAQLQLEGYIRARPQSGYYVALSEENRQLHAAMQELSPVAEEPQIQFDLRSQSILTEENELVIWKQYLKQAMNHTAISSYGEARGEYALRVSLMKHASQARGVLAHEEQLIIGASVQSLLYQVCGLLDKPAKVAIQKDIYLQARRVFEDYGMEVVDVSLGEQSFTMQELKRLHPTVLFLHSPSLFEKEKFDEQARKELMEYVQKENILLIEDDHNGELNYLREGSRALAAMDPSRSCLYMGSFSRILLPALRISYMILPQPLAKKYQEREQSYSPSAPKLEQLAFASYIADGHLRRRITRLKRQYHQKHQLMLEEAAHLHLHCVRIEESLTRYHFAYEGDIDVFLQRLQKQGIAIDGFTPDTFIISFAALPYDQLSKALTQLAKLR